MSKILGAGAALLLSTTIATAGGLDRSGQGISPLFEDGNYAELSFGMVMPSVSGVLGGALNTGDMAESYTSLGLAYKTDLSDQLSIAVIWDQPFGADITYNNADAGFNALAIPGVDATLAAHSLSALLRYKFNDRFSVHGGLRYVTMDGEIDFTGAGGGPIQYEGSSDVGYSAGVSYEIPDIALRASLTYNSSTTHNNVIDDIFGGAQVGGATETGDYDLPQSVNLDFQTGIAANTLLMASVRWADWTSTALNTQSGLGTIDYDVDSYTYTLGVARRFSDTFAGVVRVSYEASDGDLASNLAPTDGSFGITLAGIYNISDDVKLTGGINYTFVGDATTELVGTEFEDNSAIGIGLKIGYTF